VALLLHSGVVSPREERAALAAGASAVILRTVRIYRLLGAVVTMRGRAPPDVSLSGDAE